MDLTQDLLKQYLRYVPETGLFYWLKSPSNNIKPGDVAGYERLSPNNNTPYMRLSLLGKYRYLHRLAWLYVYGDVPKMLDHKDGDGTNNRIGNLRPATSSINAKNSVISSRNTSGVVGVSWVSSRSKWLAQIRDNGKTSHLGWFGSKYDAERARKNAESLCGYHKNHGRAKMF
jgi:hypothetical protein